MLRPQHRPCATAPLQPYSALLATIPQCRALRRYVSVQVVTGRRFWRLKTLKLLHCQCNQRHSGCFSMSGSHMVHVSASTHTRRPLSTYVPRASPAWGLSSLSFVACKLGSVETEALRTSWDKTVQLTSLDLSGNPLGDQGVASLSRFLIAFTGQGHYRDAAFEKSGYLLNRSLCFTCTFMPWEERDRLHGECCAAKLLLHPFGSFQVLHN